MTQTKTAPLVDHHVVITGGGSGIGLACAEEFLRDGASVSLIGRSAERLKEAVEFLSQNIPDATNPKQPCDVRYFSGDVGSEAQIEAAINAADDYKPVTLCVANAGTGGASSLLDTSLEEWQRIINTNLNGTFMTFKFAGKKIAANGGGAMCAISSIAGIRTHRLMAPYCTSKAGIDMLVKNAADELGIAGVRVNSVCPGLVETELSAGLHQNEAMLGDYLSCMPLERMGQPQDIARAVRFLCGPENSWITGAVLPVDGGHHLRRGPDLTQLS